MIFGIGDSIRVTPCGIMVTSLALLFAVYWTVGTEDSLEAALHREATHQTISLKSLLTASVEMAKLGGLEVKEVRQQVRFF